MLGTRSMARRAAGVLLAILTAGLLAACAGWPNSADLMATTSGPTVSPATERPSTATPAPTPEPSETPFISIGEDIFQALPPGNPEAGRRVSGARDCTGCHVTMSVGPLWASADDEPSLAERASLRILQPDYAGQAMTAEQYLLESIVAPDAYIVEGYPPGLMPDGLARLLSQQEAADLIAYMMTIE